MGKNLIFELNLMEKLSGHIVSLLQSHGWVVKKRNSLTIAYNNSKYSNAFNPLTGQIDQARSDTNYLKANSLTVSLGKQLKWPDDYFRLVYSVNFTQYKMRNYPIFQGINNGTSNNINFKDYTSTIFSRT